MSIISYYKVGFLHELGFTFLHTQNFTHLTAATLHGQVDLVHFEHEQTTDQCDGRDFHDISGISISLTASYLKPKLRGFSGVILPVSITFIIEYALNNVRLVCRRSP